MGGYLHFTTTRPNSIYKGFGCPLQERVDYFFDLSNRILMGDITMPRFHWPYESLMAKYVFEFLFTRHPLTREQGLKRIFIIVPFFHLLNELNRQIGLLKCRPSRLYCVLEGFLCFRNFFGKISMSPLRLTSLRLLFLILIFLGLQNFSTMQTLPDVLTWDISGPKEM